MTKKLTKHGKEVATYLLTRLTKAIKNHGGVNLDCVEVLLVNDLINTLDLKRSFSDD